MQNNNIPSANINAQNEQKLSANERAIIEKIRIPLLKTIFTRIWMLKLRLQFSGWLQYIPPLVVTLVVFLAASLFKLLRISLGFDLLMILAGILAAIQVFDLVTVKFRIRFPEALPGRRDHLNLFDLMRSRRSCRSFQTRQLTSSDLDELMKSVRLHSNEARLGASRVRFEYIAAPLTVWPTVNAGEFLVAIAPKQYDRLAVIDVGRSLQKIVMDATRMGLGTCWIGPGADQASIIRQLGDRFNAEEDHVICVCAIGYKSSYIPIFIRIFNAQFYRRLPLSALFFSDPQFQNPLEVDEPPCNQFGRTYEICQWAPSSYNGQTTRCVAVTESGLRGESRLARFDFYAVTESRYYAAVATGIWCANWELGCAAQGIKGHFALLSPEERGVAGALVPALPRYDLSWVLE